MRQRGPGSAFRDWDGVEFEHGTVWGSVPQLDFTVAVGDARLEKALVAGDEERPNLLLRPVSYTHLTLPTNREV